MRRKPFRFVEATVRFETEGGLGEKLLSRCACDQIELGSRDTYGNRLQGPCACA